MRFHWSSLAELAGSLRNSRGETWLLSSHRIGTTLKNEESPTTLLGRASAFPPHSAGPGPGGSVSLGGKLLQRAKLGIPRLPAPENRGTLKAQIRRFLSAGSEPRARSVCPGVRNPPFPLQMVWESGCVVVVMLTPLAENGVRQCYHYWPDEGSNLYHVYEVPATVPLKPHPAARSPRGPASGPGTPCPCGQGHTGLRQAAPWDSGPGTGTGTGIGSRG